MAGVRGMFEDDPTPQPERQAPSAPPVSARRGMFEDNVTAAPTARPTGGEGKPFGELRAPDPVSWSEYLRDKARDLYGTVLEPHKARHMADATLGIVGGLTGPALPLMDLTYDVPRGNVGHAALDVLGAAGGGPALRSIYGGAARIRPALEAPPWARVESPGEATAIAGGKTSWVTPSTGELLGGNGIPGPGLVNQQYEAARNAPFALQPHAGHDILSRIEQHIESRPGGYFSPSSAPEVYNILDRNADSWLRHNGPITPQDIDTLRGQLRSLDITTPAGVAGRRGANVIDNYLLNLPPGSVAMGTPQDLLAMQQTIAAARGNYRAGNVAATIERGIDRAGTRAGSRNSGMNVGNLTRQNMEQLGAVNQKTGQPNLPFSRPDERAALTEASQPGRLENKQREWGNYLGGGGGMGRLQASGWAGTAGYGLGHLLGFDPVLTGATAVGAANAAITGGRMMTRAANEAAVRGAEEAARVPLRNSPEFAARAAGAPEVADPRGIMRDAMAYALMPQAAKQGRDVWDQQFVPYENRENRPLERTPTIADSLPWFNAGPLFGEPQSRLRILTEDASNAP